MASICILRLYSSIVCVSMDCICSVIAHNDCKLAILLVGNVDGGKVLAFTNTLTGVLTCVVLAIVSLVDDTLALATAEEENFGLGNFRFFGLFPFLAGNFTGETTVSGTHHYLGSLFFLMQPLLRLEPSVDYQHLAYRASHLIADLTLPRY
uniref:Uncharacterized protein n=1 Tax=Anopheles maculatus TaxID=74869 RepID=A0A182SNM8_9DIPT